MAGMRVYSRLVVVGGRSNASPGGLMPLDARDGHAAVSRAAKMRAGLPTRADNRAGSAPGRDRAFPVWFGEKTVQVR